jgi:hypothetical protein
MTAATIPNAGKPSPTFLRRSVGLCVVRLEFVIHQVFDLERIEVAADHQTQIVGEKLNRVMILHDGRILGEDRAFSGVFDVILDRHQS